MAHFAEMSNGIVQRVIVVHNNELLVNGVETESKGAQFCHDLFGGEWLQTSYNKKFRGNFASTGYAYLADLDVFVAPQPYPSWTLDDTARWQPPQPLPSEGKWWWNEVELEWVAR